MESMRPLYKKHLLLKAGATDDMVSKLDSIKYHGDKHTGIENIEFRLRLIESPIQDMHYEILYLGLLLSSLMIMG